MLRSCNTDKCPFRYEKVTACNYYLDGICEVMSDNECLECESPKCPIDCPFLDDDCVE